MQATEKTHLKIAPSLRAGLLPDGRIILPRKFIDGLAQFRNFWKGAMTVYMAQGPDTSGNMDDCTLLPSELPCDVLVQPRAQILKGLTDNPEAVVLLSLDDFEQNGLAAVCREFGVRCAYVSEYTLRTRKQIIDATTTNPIVRMRRKYWEMQQERRRKSAVAAAAGIQCNGNPTHNAYHDLSPNALLYFDTRVKVDMLSTEDEINFKRGAHNEGQPLQILFSGRLTRMKGVMDLITVARKLRESRVDFHLSIAGDGDLKEKLEQAIINEELSPFVSMKGVLDFATELVPFARKSVDLFLCCHPQGDPSCTYLETMSCGVPILGYNNEALGGVVRSSGSGWTVPLNSPEALASEVARIQKNPSELRTMSLKALRFAREHTFEQTFLRRIDHLQNLSY